MRFGVNIPIFGEYADVRLLARMAVEAEDAGWDGFFVWDHVQWSGEDDGERRYPAVDPTVAMALIAEATSRVRIGPMVMPLARRRPQKAARELTTLDHLSGGRVTLGVGLGWPPDLEFSDFGEDPDARVRAAKLDEALEVLAGLWTGEPFEDEGRYHRVTRSQLLPRPLQERVPIWVGGEWPRNRAPFRRGARFDGVYPLLSPMPPEEQPGSIRDLVRFVSEYRTTEQPFDMACGAETVGDGSDRDRDLVQSFADAGVTWWMEPVSRSRGSLADIRARIRRGPPAV